MAELADAADSKGEPRSAILAASKKTAGSENVGERGQPSSGQSAGNPEPVDVIEVGLAHALELAVERGDLNAIQNVTAELRARREARSGTVNLASERAKRGGRKK